MNHNRYFTKKPEDSVEHFKKDRQPGDEVRDGVT